MRSVTRRVVSALTNGGDKNEPDCRQAAAAVKEVFDIAERMAALASTTWSGWPTGSAAAVRPGWRR